MLEHLPRLGKMAEAGRVKLRDLRRRILIGWRLALPLSINREDGFLANFS